MNRGIGGIERKLREADLKTERNISESFQDLDQLMRKAKEMSELAKQITSKLKEKGQLDALGDEAVQLRSELMKLGLASEMDSLAEINRKNYASKNGYYRDLGASIGKFMQPLVQRNGGQMALTDAFCALNRARGLNLISADDLLNACYTLDSSLLNLVKYESGLLVLQSAQFDQTQTNKELLRLAQEAYAADGQGLSSYQLSLMQRISLFMASQRLESAEQAGLLCRDESIQGLYFFPNKFLQA